MAADFERSWQWSPCWSHQSWRCRCHFSTEQEIWVQQGQKVRCVDDFTRSGVNACAQVVESPRPHTLNTIAALCMSLMSGSPSKEQWNPDSLIWKEPAGRARWTQCQRPCQHRRLRSYNKHHLCRQDEGFALGSVKSVRSFLRVAHSLWAILVKEFAVAWTNYFDDFVTFAKADEVASVTGSIKFVVKAGWLFAEDGDKAPDFSHRVSALGVQINVENMHCGVVTLDNTAGQKSDPPHLLDDVIASKKLNRIDALRLRGGLQFAAGQFAGRIARKSLNVVTKHAYSMCGVDLDDSAVKALKLRKMFISSSAPRTLDSSRSGLWFIFTDACFDPEAFSGVGAVLVSSDGKLQGYFSQEIHVELLKVINVTSRKTAIIWTWVLRNLLPLPCVAWPAERSWTCCLQWQRRGPRLLNRLPDQQCQQWTHTWSLFEDRILAWPESLDDPCPYWL